MKLELARGAFARTLTRYPNYTIVYRPETDPLEIVAVLHGKRNIRRILRQRP
jgi:plasmid stabilization system protein ParE